MWDCYGIISSKNFKRFFLQVFLNEYLFLQSFLDNGPHSSCGIQVWTTWKPLQKELLLGCEKLFDDASFEDWCIVLLKKLPELFSFK